MSGRISSAGMHGAAIAEILAQQSKLSRVQTQVASGKRIQSPADDPIASTRILDMERTRTQLEQFGKNSIALTNRLQSNEQALTEVGGVLQRVRELSVYANSAALDHSGRVAIATEISARVKELQDIGNRRDATGEYLFSGYATQTQPFSRGVAGVSYAGDQGERALQIAPDQRVADGFSGYQVFMNIPEDNGTFATSTGVHNGTGSIDNGRVVNPAAWVPGSYTVRFATATTWEVVDATATVIATGAYSEGSAIAFNGAQVTVGGTPAAGDTFLLQPAGKESLFDTLDELVLTLTTSEDTPSGRSLLNTGIGAALAQIDQGLTKALNLRAEVGSRLSTVDSAADSREALAVDLKSGLSELQDLDYAEALGRMNQMLTGLQAAQTAYTKISQLSLFNFM
jgi:flagellar hook-associated protein 3 FlgL